MSDTIYREDAIKAIEELRKEPHWLHDGDDYRVCGLSEAEDAVKRLPSANSHLDELRKAIENLCNSCDRPSEKELGEIILSAMTSYSIGQPSNSEKPNNCEHITEDGVTCAKYPACDDCFDNPLNKVKGSKRLLKGKTEPTISKMEQVDKDINVRSKDEPQTERPTRCSECKVWRRCFKEKPSYNLIKSRCPIDEPQVAKPFVKKMERSE